MFKVKTLNHISPACKEILTEDRYTLSDTMESPDAIFVRATNMHEYEFNPELLCIARAGIGVNSIPVDRCTENGIVVFNSPGANANGVKELFVFGNNSCVVRFVKIVSLVGKYNFCTFSI